MKRRLAIALFTATLSSPSFADCHIQQYRFFFGSDTSTTGKVTGGSTCKIRPGASAGAGFSSISITGQATHGHAATNGSTSYPEVTYKPAAGYKGQDQFVFTVVGGGKRLQGPSNITVTMDVQ